MSPFRRLKLLRNPTADGERAAFLAVLVPVAERRDVDLAAVPGRGRVDLTAAKSPRLALCVNLTSETSARCANSTYM